LPLESSQLLTLRAGESKTYPGSEYYRITKTAGGAACVILGDHAPIPFDDVPLVVGPDARSVQIVSEADEPTSFHVEASLSGFFVVLPKPKPAPIPEKPAAAESATVAEPEPKRRPKRAKKKKASKKKKA